MKKDLVVKNFECGNSREDITLSISPITFLVGPDERKKDAILNVVEEELNYRNTYLFSNAYYDNDYDSTSYNHLKETKFAKKWISKLGIVNDGTDRNHQLLMILSVIDSAIEEKSVGLAIKDPECHLYPATQSLLADMFYEAYNDYGIHFIVETHSEYLIRKTQVMVAEKNYETKEELEEKCPFTTYYVPDQSTGRVPYSMEYRRDGRFKKRFDSGFYDEASNLVDEIL